MDQRVQGGQGSVSMIERRERKDGTYSYRVRYRAPDGRFRSRSFARRSEAAEYERQVLSQRRRGDWVDPQRGRSTLAAVWGEYQGAGISHLRATTQAGYRHAWKHIEPTFGGWPVAKIEHADVAEWVTDLSARLGTDTVRKAHGVLCRVLDYAAATRRVPANVARGVRLPKRAPVRERILTVEEVHALAEAMPQDRDVVLSLAYMGLRWSELAALRVEDVNLTRRRVHVVQRATEVDGRIDVDQPKSRAGHRYVPIPQLLVPSLTERLAGRPKDALVYGSPEGGYLRVRNWRRRAGFDKALESLGMVATPHDLRRTFGSLARMAGADLRFIQKAMGHESITTTARIYAHLYDDELDTIAAALDGLYSAGHAVGEI